MSRAAPTRSDASSEPYVTDGEDKSVFILKTSVGSKRVWSLANFRPENVKVDTTGQGLSGDAGNAIFWKVDSVS